QPPLAGDALELREAAVLDLHPRAGDGVLHGARDQQLARLRLSGDTRADVHRDSADLRLEHFALACMQPRANPEVELRQALPDVAGAADRARGSVEGGEEA